jgi:hypothetical protein
MGETNIILGKMNKIWRKEKITTLTKNESQPYSTSDANWF